jgi:hypothetical protein
MGLWHLRRRAELAEGGAKEAAARFNAEGEGRAEKVEGEQRKERHAQ